MCLRMCQIGNICSKEKNLDIVKHFHLTKEGNLSECLVCNMSFAGLSLNTTPISGVPVCIGTIS